MVRDPQPEPGTETDREIKAASGAGGSYTWRGRQRGISDDPAVQAGHRVSSFRIKKTGELDRLAIEDADLNQVASNTMESNKIWADRKSVVIGDVIIDLATAEKLARDPEFPALTPAMVRLAISHPGWERNKGMDPEYAKKKFMDEMLDIIVADPNHPLRPLIKKIK